MEWGLKRGSAPPSGASWIWLSRNSPVSILVGPYGVVTVYLWLIKSLTIEYWTIYWAPPKIFNKKKKKDLTLKSVLYSESHKSEKRAGMELPPISSPASRLQGVVNNDHHSFQSSVLSLRFRVLVNFFLPPPLGSRDCANTKVTEVYISLGFVFFGLTQSKQTISLMACVCWASFTFKTPSKCALPIKNVKCSLCPLWTG